MSNYPLGGAEPGDDMNSAQVKSKRFLAVIGDNAAGPDGHHAGFNGIWSLVPNGFPEDFIAPGLAGLNLGRLAAILWGGCSVRNRG